MQNGVRVVFSKNAWVFQVDQFTTPASMAKRGLDRRPRPTGPAFGSSSD